MRERREERQKKDGRDEIMGEGGWDGGDKEEGEEKIEGEGGWDGGDKEEGEEKIEGEGGWDGGDKEEGEERGKHCGTYCFHGVSAYGVCYM